MLLTMQASAQGCEEVRLELPGEATSIKEARDAVATLAVQVGARVGDVKLAVSEAVSNAVIHGFRDRRAGRISVRARPERGRLLVVVADNGGGMRPNVDSPGLGLGLSLITKLASEVRFDSTDRGLTVSMTFDAGAT